MPKVLEFVSWMYLSKPNSFVQKLAYHNHITYNFLPSWLRVYGRLKFCQNTNDNDGKERKSYAKNSLMRCICYKNNSSERN